LHQQLTAVKVITKVINHSDALPVAVVHNHTEPTRNEPTEPNSYAFLVYDQLSFVLLQTTQ